MKDQREMKRWRIFQVKFEDDMRISKMYSAEQEEVSFRKDIYPIGNVEDWMCEIERVMRETLRQVIRDALDDYLEVNHISFHRIISKIFSSSDHVNNGYNIGLVKLLLLVHKHIGPNKSQKPWKRRILRNIINNNCVNWMNFENLFAEN